jgi:hypothetical protein
MNSCPRTRMNQTGVNDVRLWLGALARMSPHPVPTLARLSKRGCKKHTVERTGITRWSTLPRANVRFRPNSGRSSTTVNFLPSGRWSDSKTGNRVGIAWHSVREL